MRTSSRIIAVSADGNPPGPVSERRGTTAEGMSCKIVTLYSGDFYVTNEPDQMIMTILGSCVAACLYDPVANIGGMNHFLLPSSQELQRRPGDDSARYGAFAMEQLINGILMLGGVKSRLEAKVFGGANVTRSSAMIGTQNVEFVRRFLSQENLPIVSEDLGDSYPRRVRFFPASGKAQMLKLRRTEDMQVAEEEKRFADALSTRPLDGKIELF